MNLKTLTIGASLLLASASSSALNIALTNDDGWSTPGIQALYEALTQAGHTVILAGPLDAQSGSGTAFNIGDLEITKQAENQYSVALEGGLMGAEPATSGAIGLNIIATMTGATPDLLVSGINDGSNVGAATYTSGTVGATMHAAGRVVGGTQTPAIAISTDERCDEEVEEPTEECREVAAFVVDYIDHLTERPNYVAGKSALIPNGRALNINFPPGEPMGVKMANQGTLPVLRGSLASIEMGCADCLSLEVGESTSGGIVALTPLEEEDTVTNADQNLFLEGYITVVVIEPSFNVSKAKSLKTYLDTFEY